MKVLITGVKSGLGKHCFGYFFKKGHAVDTYHRETDFSQLQENAAEQAYDLIVHAAFNTRKDISTSNLSDYLDDNLFLTQRLTQLPHEKFVFISSSDVYPKNDVVHQEDEEIFLTPHNDIYAISKLMCEAIVKKSCENFLILRPTALLGPHAKLNSLMKVLINDPIKISLAKTSTFNYVLHEDVTDFINAALKENLRGIFNIAVAKNISLAEVVTNFCVQSLIEFGNYCYTTGHISQQKAVQHFSGLARDSLESIRLFREQHSHANVS